MWPTLTCRHRERGHVSTITLCQINAQPAPNMCNLFYNRGLPHGSIWKKTLTCDSGDNSMCMGVHERVCVFVSLCVWHQHMPIMPPSKAEDSCTVVKTVERRKGQLNMTSLNCKLRNRAWEILELFLQQTHCVAQQLMAACALCFFFFEANFKSLSLSKLWQLYTQHIAAAFKLMCCVLKFLHVCDKPQQS